MSDETPTERFTPLDDTETVSPNSSRPLVLVLSIIGGVLLIVIIILLMLLFSRGSGTSGDEGAGLEISATPSATPGASPRQDSSTPPSASPAPSANNPPPAPPQATMPRFTQFTAPASQMCSAGGPGVAPTRPTFTVSWATADAVEAWFINGTDDAKDSGFMQIPLSGDQDDFPYEQPAECSDGSNVYTITLVGSDGTHVNKTWTVAITGDHF